MSTSVSGSSNSKLGLRTKGCATDYELDFDRALFRSVRAAYEQAAPTSIEDYPAWRNSVVTKHWEAQQASQARTMAIMSRIADLVAPSDINKRSNEDNKTEASKPVSDRAVPAAAQVDPADTTPNTARKRHGRAINLTGPMAGRRWLTEKEVEEIYGYVAKTLRNWRSLRKGPPCRYFGTAVMYQVAALDAWIERQPQGGEGAPSSAIKRCRKTKKPAS